MSLLRPPDPDERDPDGLFDTLRATAARDRGRTTPRRLAVIYGLLGTSALAAALWVAIIVVSLIGGLAAAAFLFGTGTP